jgi:hypothetical protein
MLPERLREPSKDITVRIAGLRVDNGTRNSENKKPKRYQLGHNF